MEPVLRYRRSLQLPSHEFVALIGRLLVIGGHRVRVNRRRDVGVRVSEPG